MVLVPFAQPALLLPRSILPSRHALIALLRLLLLLVRLRPLSAFAACLLS